MMTREEIILSHIKRDGLGLEIGAGCAPLAPKKQGFRVHVLDHCDKEALIEKYRPHGIAVENIEEVDFVWDGRPYTELIGRRHVYDWMIASHVLEHTTDLIGFLNDCDSLFKEKRRRFAGGSPQASFFRSLSPDYRDRARYRCREESTERSSSGNGSGVFSNGSEPGWAHCLGFNRQRRVQTCPFIG